MNTNCQTPNSVHESNVGNKTKLSKWSPGQQRLYIAHETPKHRSVRNIPTVVLEVPGIPRMAPMRTLCLKFIK